MDFMDFMKPVVQIDYLLKYLNSSLFRLFINFIHNKTYDLVNTILLRKTSIYFPCLLVCF